MAGQSISRSRANTGKYRMFQKKIISIQIRKYGISRVLKVRFLFYKAQLAPPTYFAYTKNNIVLDY